MRPSTFHAQYDPWPHALFAAIVNGVCKIVHVPYACNPSIPHTQYNIILKIINTSQGHIHKYEDLKRKIYNCTTKIYFNQKYLSININLIPHFANIKTLNTSSASKFTRHKAFTIRIKDEIKYLYIKKVTGSYALFLYVMTGSA
jgi:hypothetical protein